MPELNLQTQDKMLEASSELTVDRLLIIDSALNQESLTPGRLYFLNTQKLGARADLVESGHINRWQVVAPQPLTLLDSPAAVGEFRAFIPSLLAELQ